MSDDATNYRARAAAEIADGAGSPLANVRERSERSAAKWTEMADRADRVATSRRGREAEAEERRANAED